MTVAGWWTTHKTNKQKIAELTRTVAIYDRILDMADLNYLYDDAVMFAELKAGRQPTRREASQQSYDEIIARYIPRARRERLGFVGYTKYRVAKRLAGDLVA